MSKKRLLKEITESGSDRRSDVLNNLKQRYPQYVENTSDVEAKKSRKDFIFMKLVPAISAAVCVTAVTGAVVFGKYAYDNSRFGHTEVTDFYVVALDAGYTIRDYGRDNGLNYKCLDSWYEFAADITSYCLLENDTDMFVGVRESMYNPNTDDLMYMDVVPANINVHSMERIDNSVDQSYDCGKFTVKWAVNPDDEYYGVAEYEGYKYYLVFYQPSNESLLIDTFIELLG